MVDLLLHVSEEACLGRRWSTATGKVRASLAFRPSVVLTILFAYASYFLAKLVIKIINKLIGIFTKKKAVA